MRGAVDHERPDHLTLPTDTRFRGVATLVLGGVGTRLNLPYERVDDLQLAVLSLLEASGGDRVTVEVAAEPEKILVSVGLSTREARAMTGSHGCSIRWWTRSSDPRATRASG